MKQPIVIPRLQTTSLTPLKCDFCDAVRPQLMFFAARGFQFLVSRDRVDVEAGAWGACEDCAPVVMARDVHGMIRLTKPDSLVGLAYMTKLISNLVKNFLNEPAPILTRVRLLPDNGRWVESDSAAPKATDNPYVTSNN